MTKNEEKGIADICLFTVLLYVNAWFQAPYAPSAPRTDLQLLKAIHKYKEKNAAIAGAALKKILGHLWYLSKELVTLAFFDDTVSDECKRHMITALQNPGEEHLKKTTIDHEMTRSNSQILSQKTP